MYHFNSVLLRLMTQINGGPCGAAAYTYVGYVYKIYHVYVPQLGVGNQPMEKITIYIENNGIASNVSMICIPAKAMRCLICICLFTRMQIYLFRKMILFLKKNKKYLKNLLNVRIKSETSNFLNVIIKKCLRD